jgi:hypothetical protein
MYTIHSTASTIEGHLDQLAWCQSQRWVPGIDFWFVGIKLPFVPVEWHFREEKKAVWFSLYWSSI